MEYNFAFINATAAINTSDCTNKTIRDSQLAQEERTQYAVMFGGFTVCSIYALIATVILIKAMRKKCKVQMVLFYILADVTLIGKYDAISDVFS